MSFYKPTEKEAAQLTKQLDDMLHEKPRVKRQPDFDPDYMNLNIQNPVFRMDHDKQKKDEWTFNESLMRINERDFPTHLPIRTKMKIIMNYKEGTLPHELDPIAIDMITGGSEWSCELIETKEDEIAIYENHNGLIWNPLHFVYQPSMKNHFYRPTGEPYKIVNSKGQRLESQKLINIEKVAEINPDIIKRLYTVDFDKLPAKIKAESIIELPPLGAIRPIGFGHNGKNYGITPMLLQASRGCKPK